MNLVNISQIVFNIAMIKLIISNQLEMKFQKFSDGLKLLTVNGVVTLLTTFSLLKIRRSLTLTCQLSVLELQTMHMWLTIQGLLTILNGANAGNRDQLTRQYCMETYLPNSIKKSKSISSIDRRNKYL